MAASGGPLEELSERLSEGEHRLSQSFSYWLAQSFLVSFSYVGRVACRAASGRLYGIAAPARVPAARRFEGAVFATRCPRLTAGLVWRRV